MEQEGLEERFTVTSSYYIITGPLYFSSQVKFYCHHVQNFLRCKSSWLRQTELNACTLRLNSINNQSSQSYESPIWPPRGNYHLQHDTQFSPNTSQEKSLQQLLCLHCEKIPIITKGFYFPHCIQPGRAAGHPEHAPPLLNII